MNEDFKLPPDWEALMRKHAVPDLKVSFAAAARKVVVDCYALHCKPQRELTDAEIVSIRKRLGTPLFGCVSFARDVIAAHQRKQREPETVKFRAARSKITGSVVMCNTSEKCANWHEWEWLEPAQEIEVKV